MKSPLHHQVSLTCPRNEIKGTYRDSIFVVGCRENLLDYKLPPACDNRGVISEVSMLEEDTIIFFMNTDGILDLTHATRLGREVSIQVVDRALAITAQSEAVGQIPGAVFPKVKSVLALMRMLWVAAGK